MRVSAVLLALVTLVGCGGDGVATSTTVGRNAYWRSDYTALSGDLPTVDLTDDEIDMIREWYCDDTAVGYRDAVDGVKMRYFTAEEMDNGRSDDMAVAIIGATAAAVNCDGLVERDVITNGAVRWLENVDRPEMYETWRDTYRKISGTLPVAELTERQIEEINAWYCVGSGEDISDAALWVTEHYVPARIASELDRVTPLAGIAIIATAAETQDCDGVVDRDRLAPDVIEVMRRAAA